MIPKLPVVKPTTIFSVVTTAAAITEFPATERFSARMDSGLYEGAGEAIAALSLDATVSASPFAVRHSNMPYNAQKHLLE